MKFSQEDKTNPMAKPFDDNKLPLKLLIYAGGACTLIGGLLHILVASNAIGLNFPVGVFFLVAGTAQVFWTLPMVRTWGKVWYVIGLGVLLS